MKRGPETRVEEAILIILLCTGIMIGCSLTGALIIFILKLFGIDIIF